MSDQLDIDFETVDMPIIATTQAMQALTIGGDFDFNLMEALGRDPDFQNDKPPFPMIEDYSGAPVGDPKSKDPKDRFRAAMRQMERERPGITESMVTTAAQMGIDLDTKNPDHLKTLRLLGMFQWFKDRGKPPILISDDLSLRNILQQRGFHVVSTDHFARELNKDMAAGKHVAAGLKPTLKLKADEAGEMDLQRMALEGKQRETLKISRDDLTGPEESTDPKKQIDLDMD
jgi:hypothetical protein